MGSKAIGLLNLNVNEEENPLIDNVNSGPWNRLQLLSVSCQGPRTSTQPIQVHAGTSNLLVVNVSFSRNHEPAVCQLLLEPQACWMWLSVAPGTSSLMDVAVSCSWNVKLAGCGCLTLEIFLSESLLT